MGTRSREQCCTVALDVLCCKWLTPARYDFRHQHTSQRFHLNLRMHQRQWLDLVRLLSALLSACGSSYVIRQLYPQKPWVRPHVRACLALVVAGSDLVFNLTQIITGGMEIDDGGITGDTVSGNLDNLCYVLGPLVYLSGWFAFAITLMIAHYIHHCLIRHPSSSDARCLLISYSVTAFIYSASVTAVIASWHKFTVSDSGGCWVDIRTHHNVRWQGIFFVCTLIVPLVLCLGCLVKTWCNQKKDKPSAPACVSRRSNRVMRSYLAVLGVVWSPVIARHSYATFVDGQISQDCLAYNILLATECFLLPLQGLLNAVVFKISEHQRQSSEGRKGLRQVAFGGVTGGQTDGHTYRKQSQQKAIARKSKLAEALFNEIGAVSDPDASCMMARTLSELLRRDEDELNMLLENTAQLHEEIEILQQNSFNPSVDELNSDTEDEEDTLETALIHATASSEVDGDHGKS